ncbi:MAG: DUF4342 domain-containing protein [Nitrososphaerales archaeon]
MVKCEKCESELPEKANFCPNCGHSTGRMIKEEFKISSEDLVKKVKDLIKEGNITKIIVKNEKDRVLLEMPVTAGVVGTILAPWLAALGVIAALATKCTISVERRALN